MFFASKNFELMYDLHRKTVKGHSQKSLHLLENCCESQESNRLTFLQAHSYAYGKIRREETKTLQLFNRALEHSQFPSITSDTKTAGQTFSAQAAQQIKQDNIK